MTTPAIFAEIQEGTIWVQTDHGRWEISEALFKTPQSSLTLQGNIQPDQTIRFTARLDTQQLKELAGPLGRPELNGEGAMTAALTGDLRNPSVGGQIALQTFTIHDRHLGSFSSRFRSRDSVLVLSSAVVLRGESRTTGQAKLNLNAGLAAPV